MVTVVAISISKVVAISISMPISMVVEGIGLRSSSGISISRPLAIGDMAIGIGVGMVGTMEGGDYGVVAIVVAIGKTMSIDKAGISISRPLAIGVVKSIAMVKAIQVSIAISMVKAISQVMSIAIAIEGISISISISCHCSKEAESHDSHGFHHTECLQARGFS